MAVVTLQDIHKTFGPEVVLDQLNLQLHDGEKVGMVGANGSGKTTILKLITGQISPDMGRVIRQKGLRIGYLPQEATFSGQRTVLEEMHAGVEHLLKLQEAIHNVAHEMESLSGAELQAKMRQYDRLGHEFEIAGGYAYETRIQMTLAALGFEPELHHVRTEALSGGQLSRLGLAQVLMLQTDLLLLDEPTNHLDLQATEWLERFLGNYQGAAVLISHDRYLLDRVACKIVEVENRQAKVWPGNYSNYVQTRETVRLQEEREYTRRVEMVERTRDFIARNKDQEGMRGTARGRKIRLNRLLKQNPDFLDKPTHQKTISFSFGKTDKTSDLVLRCEGLGKSYGEITLFEDLTFDLLNGERLGITGPNGTGKTTLLELALGRTEPSAGRIRMGESLRIGYLDQHGDVLDANRSVLEEAWSANPELVPEQVRNRLGTFLLSGDDVYKLCGELSGGQRSRLMLCKLVISAPDVLILDEPTNHLDIASREMLEAALDDYTGTIIVVSHDRYFLDQIVDKLLVVGTDELGRRQLGRTELMSGTPAYSLYADTIRQRLDAEEQRKVQEAEAQKRQSAGRQPQSEIAAPTTKTPEELKRFNRYTVDQLEDMILRLEHEIDGMKQRFGDAEIYKNPDRLAELQQDYNGKQTELDLLYRAYDRRAG
ncbi:MAG: ABC-F family ATP-binding cassette domain-containing protein [Planctomycetes bacterium]|jgi:ATP-binding cassette subfamily F protein 3|nr:ABC-F family ATP-binding cassette domain-containing protein [Planctomycetota bacterium]